MSKRMICLVLIAILSIVVLSGVATNLSAIKVAWKEAADGAKANLPASTVDGTTGWHAVAGDAYDYPVTAKKTPEIWRTYISHVDMMKALQLPSDVLKSISTAGLIETCINYSLFGDYTAFDSYYDGIKMIERNFNGLQELYQRTDAATEFVRFYQSINVVALLKSADYPQFQLSYIEFILANETLVKQMTSEQRVLLLKAVLKNVYLRDSVKRFSTEDYSKAFLLGRVLAEHSPAFQARLAAEETTQDFLEYGNIRTGDLTMITGARDFIRTIESMILELK